MSKQMWKCRRCGEIVDMEKFKCGCYTSPSPWEPFTPAEGTEAHANAIIESLKSKKANYCTHCYQEINAGEEAKHENGKCNEICTDCGCPVHPCLPCEEVVLLNGNHTDDTYKDLLKLILKDGRRKKNRTGIDTIGVFGAQAKFDVNMDAFPILTTKKVWFKGIVHELLWFLRGDTNIKYLVDNGVHIWDEWAYKRYVDGFCPEAKANAKEMIPSQDVFINLILKDTDFAQKWGELGEGTYGGMWRGFPYALEQPETEYGAVKGTETVLKRVDQLQKVMDKLKKNPDDRRIIVSAWHPYWVDHCALPPCHCLFHFNTEELTLDERLSIFSRGWNLAEARQDWAGQDEHKMLDEHCIPRRRVNCLLYQRSCDTFLGVPFNITSYSLLLAMVAHCAGMEPGTFTHTYGDLHLYENHLDQVKQQLDRTPKVLPKLWLNPRVTNLFDFKFDDIKLVDYQSHAAIKADIAV